MPSARAFAFAALMVVLTLGAILVHDRIFAHPFLHPRNDFTTFYCAGTLARARSDPYRVEPLRACEHRLGELAPPKNAPWEVIPAPFPGYALALFAAMSLPPPEPAHVVWFGVLLAGVAVTALAAARLSGFALLPVATVVAVTVGFWDLSLGEPTPIVAALLGTAALCASRGAWPAAGVLTGLAMIMPHVALPACVALLAFAPRARPALLVTGAALAAVSVATLGAAANVEYFVRTLPAHAASELFFGTQYSLTHELALAGVSAHAAMLAGSVSYVALLAAGVWAGRRLALAGEPACLVLVPAAVASVGGAFAHDIQILTGVAAAIVVAAMRSVPARLAVVPVLLYAVLWSGDPAWRGSLVVTAASGAAALWMASERVARSARRRWSFAATAGAALVAGFVVLHALPTRASDGATAGAPAPQIAATDQASAVWAYRNGLVESTSFDPRRELQKAPLVAGVLMLLACAGAARLRGGGAAAPGRGQELAVAGTGDSSRTIVS